MSTVLSPVLAVVERILEVMSESRSWTVSGTDPGSDRPAGDRNRRKQRHRLLCTALELARKGATVVLTARDAKKGNEAKSRILSVDSRRAKVEVGSLDLASLDSVCAFAGKEMQESPSTS